MSAHNYPDHFYADALSRANEQQRQRQRPSGAYDAAKLREDTIALAVSQDRDNDALPSILAEMRALVARLERYAARKPYDDALADISEATKAPKWSPEWVAPSAEGLTTRVIKPNHDPEHLAWHVTGDGADFSVERDSAGSRL